MKKGNLFRPFPKQIKIEVARGCTRKCSFCGIVTLDKDEDELMNRDTMLEIAKQFPMETKMASFALFGEPTRNPELPYMISLLRCKNIDLQITVISNGDLLTEELVHELFKSGLSFLHLDAYDKKSGERMMEILKKVKHQYRIYNYYNIPFNTWTYQPKHSPAIIYCDEFHYSKRDKKATRKLHNFGGNMSLAMIEKLNMEKKTKMTKCSEPYKNLVITYDGRYVICCMDFSRSLQIGRLESTPILDFWNGEIIKKIRWIHENKRRDLIPVCSICNHSSFRAGLYYYDGPEYNLIEEAERLSSISVLSKHQLNLRRIYGYE